MLAEFLSETVKAKRWEQQTCLKYCKKNILNQDFFTQ